MAFKKKRQGNGRLLIIVYNFLIIVVACCFMINIPSLVGSTSISTVNHIHIDNISQKNSI